MTVKGEFDQPIGEPVKPIYEGETAVLVATGPSVKDQIDEIRKAKIKHGARLITVNNAYEIAPFTDAHISCNLDWWRHYWPKSAILREMGCPKFTWYKDVAKDYGIQYVKAIVKDGLSTDPRILHINHGSGPMAINLALHLGIKKLLLVGHDMKFGRDYNGRAKKTGSSDRHFFGEYPKKLQHFPSIKVGKSAPGVLDGLIEAYNKMPNDLKKGGMKVINCTPNSALPTFPMSTLEKEL